MRTVDSMRYDVGLIRKAYPAINIRSWLERTEMWIARHNGRINLLTDVVVGLHKNQCMSDGSIGESSGRKRYTPV